MNVLLDECIKKPVVAEFRVLFVEPFDLSGQAFVNGIIFAGSHARPALAAHG